MQLEFSFKEIVSAFMVLFAIIDITGSIPVILDIKSKGGKVQALPAAIGSFIVFVVFLFTGENYWVTEYGLVSFYLYFIFFMHFAVFQHRDLM